MAPKVQLTKKLSMCSELKKSQGTGPVVHSYTVPVVLAPLSIWHTLSGGGRILELFFDGVCGPRSETLTHF